MNISVRDALVPVSEGKNLFDGLRQLGLKAIEIEVRRDGSTPHVPVSAGAPGSISNDAAVRELGRRLREEGIGVSALLLGTDFASDDPDGQVQWAVTAVRAAAALGAPAVRIDTATRNRALSAEQVRENFIQRIGQVLAQTADTPIGLGIENHGHISNDPAFLDGVFAAVGDDRLGMTLDTGNFYWYGWPLSQLYRTLEHFAPRAKHTHIKNINYPAEMVEKRREIGYEYGKYCSPLDEGNIDIARVVQLLKAAGYTGDLCIENEALGKYPQAERIGVLRRDADTLARAVAAAGG
jgi:sugar phosphate isomerase/epimerase